MTREELASKAGLTAKAISALERGERKRPHPHTVRSLADALGLLDTERCAPRFAVSFRGARAYFETGEDPLGAMETMGLAAALAHSCVTRG